MSDRIIVNIKSEQQVVAEAEANPTDPLDELCEATLKRRGRRGAPKGTGRMHAEDVPGLLAACPDEEALVRLARSLSNQNPALARRLAGAGR